jgi:hypothetical protein
MCRDVYYWIDRPALDAVLASLSSDIIEPHQYKAKKEDDDHS